MSYIIEQKIKGRIYLYEVESYWDKEKKQPRQRRKYLGPKERKYKQRKNNPEGVTSEEGLVQRKSMNVVSRSYGAIFLIKFLFKNLGIEDLVKREFPDYWREVLSLSAYFVCEGRASYLFPHWQEEHHMDDVRRLHSSDLSVLYEYLGREEEKRWNFLSLWGKHLSPREGIYYDITSISSYGLDIELVQWGYNRDKESLPQINLGLTHCKKSGLPVSYQVYPGSLVDVSTLKNMIKVLNLFQLRDLFFILDRGFCSVSNVKEMLRNDLKFIQPLSFLQDMSKKILKKHASQIVHHANAFIYKSDILYHAREEVDLGGYCLSAHVIYNEKAALAKKNNLYQGILAVEAKIKATPQSTLQECQDYIENHIPKCYKKFFRIEGENRIVVDQENLEEAVFRAGALIFLVHGQSLTPSELIESYRNRDAIEKDMDTLKNELDTHRMRAHSDHTVNGRLFIKFLSLIIKTHIRNVTKNHEKLHHESIPEILAELKKLKINSWNGSKPFLAEPSKKQKIIFKAFGIDIQETYNTLNGY